MTAEERIEFGRLGVRIDARRGFADVLVQPDQDGVMPLGLRVTDIVVEGRRDHVVAATFSAYVAHLELTDLFGLGVFARGKQGVPAAYPDVHITQGGVEVAEAVDSFRWTYSVKDGPGGAIQMGVVRP